MDRPRVKDEIDYIVNLIVNKELKCMNAEEGLEQ
jgi:hypothetical protein